MYFMVDIGFEVSKAFRTVMMSLCSIIYKLIIFCFDVFSKMGDGRILESDTIHPIIVRIEILLGLFMVFRLSFAFIQYIINPDDMTDKTKGIGNIVKRIIISIVLLGSVSGIFDLAYRTQHVLIQNQIVSRIILPEVSSGQGPGSTIARNLFETFFRETEAAKKDSSINKTDYENIYEHALDLIAKGDFTTFSYIVNEESTKKISVDGSSNTKTVKYFIYEWVGGGIGTVIIGAIALYIIFMFTIQAGVRLIQLAYLEIISPIPIMMYITPKGDEMLKKWFKQCTTTFLDFFIRVAIIDFVIRVISTLADKDSDVIRRIIGDGASDGTKMYVVAIMIIALLLFAKRAPDLISEIFPSMGTKASLGLGLDFKKNIVEPIKSAYNNPVIGLPGRWTSGLIQGIDRKAHGKHFFGDSKIRKAVDKWLPEQARVRQDKIQAKEAIEARHKLNSKGEEIALSTDVRIENGSRKLQSSAFKHQDYRRTYERLGAAKSAEKAANLALKTAETEYEDIVTSTTATQAQKDAARARYEAALGAVKAAGKRVEAAKMDHDNMKKIHRDDAKIEDAFNYYNDMNPYSATATGGRSGSPPPPPPGGGSGSPPPPPPGGGSGGSGSPPPGGGSTSGGRTSGGGRTGSGGSTSGGRTSGEGRTGSGSPPPDGGSGGGSGSPPPGGGSTSGGRTSGEGRTGSGGSTYSGGTSGDKGETPTEDSSPKVDTRPGKEYKNSEDYAPRDQYKKGGDWAPRDQYKRFDTDSEEDKAETPDYEIIDTYYRDPNYYDPERYRINPDDYDMPTDDTPAAPEIVFRNGGNLKNAYTILGLEKLADSSKSSKYLADQINKAYKRVKDYYDSVLDENNPDHRKYYVELEKAKRTLLDYVKNG